MNRTIFYIEEGNAIIVNSKQMHYGFSSDRTDCQYICIVFSPSILSNISEIKNKYVLPIIDSNFSEFLLTANIPSHQSLLLLLKQLYKLYEQKDVDFELSAIGQIYNIWKSTYQLVLPHYTGLQL